MNDSLKYDTLLLIGPPGSGKETQGKLLAERFGWYHSETGREFRRLAENNTDEGRALREALKTPNLLDSKYADRFLEEALALLKPGQGIVLDGYSRDVGQATRLLETVTRHKRKLLVISIHLHDSIACRRMEERALKIHRPDSDTPDKRIERLSIYRQNMPSVLEKFMHCHAQVSGSPSVENVHRGILQMLSM